MTDYTDAIKDLQAEVRFWEAAVKGQEDGIKVLQAEVKRLKDCNDELREAQTYIDHYGDKWLTSAKDVPTSAYNHGYMDGKNEAESHWVSVFDDLPRRNAVVVISDGKRSWDVGQYHFLFKADDRTIWWWKKHTTRKVLWWMYKEDALPEPPQEVRNEAD